MITAYCLHLSEGVPVRRILETKSNGNEINVNITECNWEWNKKENVKTFKFFVKSKPWWVNTLDFADWTIHQQKQYHKKFRRQMSNEHNWRFEIYWPMSSLV